MVFFWSEQLVVFVYSQNFATNTTVNFRTFLSPLKPVATSYLWILSTFQSYLLICFLSLWTYLFWYSINGMVYDMAFESDFFYLAKCFQGDRASLLLPFLLINSVLLHMHTVVLSWLQAICFRTSYWMLNLQSTESWYLTHFPLLPSIYMTITFVVWD